VFAAADAYAPPTRELSYDELAALGQAPEPSGEGDPAALGNADFSDFASVCPPPARERPRGRRGRSARRPTAAQRRAARRRAAAKRRREAARQRKLVEVGRRLFDSTTAFGQQPSKSPTLSGQEMSCATCHFGPAFTDDRIHLVPTQLRRLAPRNTPHLLALAATLRRESPGADEGGFGWDGRFPCAQAVMKGAIMNPVEMHASREPTQRQLDALVAFVGTLKPPPAVPGVDFDEELAAEGKRIFDTPRPASDALGGEFGASTELACATCHTGLHRTDNKFHRLLFSRGDPLVDPGRVDPDGNDPGTTPPTVDPGSPGSEPPGHEPGQIVGFRTPSLVGLRFSSPYFHEGGSGYASPSADPAQMRTAARASLLETVAFYDRRFALNLTPHEQAALVEYLMSL
jgi:cytochrome c peroxidase